MALLEPVTAIVAAAIAVPLLLALYILKLRRRPHRIASTMLWRQAFDDLKVNVPFRRLRANLLLFMQLIALLCVLLALGEPVGPADGAGLGSRVVILVDQSASMSALIERRRAGAEPRTRLDAARERALEIVDLLARGGGTPEVTVIAFGATARVVAGFGMPLAEARSAIEAIEPTDEIADLASALDLASVFASAADESGTVAPPDVVLVSDGGVHEEAYAVRAGRFRHERIAATADGATPPVADNVGIVDFGAQRNRDDPARLDLFARLASARDRASDVAIEVRLDGDVVRTLATNIPPVTDGAPGSARVAVQVDVPDGGLLTARLAVDDDLSADDAAALVMPPPVRPRVVIVHAADEADPELVSIIEAFDPAELRVMTAGAWAGLDPVDVDQGRVADLVVFDRVSADRLPGVPTLTFGGVPARLETLDAPDLDLGRRVLAWERTHPLMRNVGLDSVVYRRFGAFAVPVGGRALVFGPDGPVALVVRSRGAEHVVVGFALEESNWPLDLSFAVFMQNAFDHLLLRRAGSARVAHPGEPVVVRSAADADDVVVDGPAFAAPRAVPARPAAPVTLPRLTRAGVYRVEGVVPGDATIAVSVLSTMETDVRPRAVTATALEADRAAAVGSARRDLRPWLIAVAIGVLTLEWLVYCRRAMVG